MKHILSFIILFPSFFLFGQEPLEYTLDECIEYALENNEQLKIASLENQISEAKVGETLSIGLPQVTASAGVTNNIEIQRAFIEDFISPAVYGVLIENGLLPPETPIPEPQTFAAAFAAKNTGQLGLNASQLIFDGSYFVGLEAARKLKEQTKEQEVKTRIDVIEAVAKAYYLVLVTSENLELLGSNYSRLDSLLNDTQQLYESGFAEKIDVNRIQIQFNNVETDLKNRTESLITAISLLKFQMGMPISQPLKLEDELSELEFDPIDLTALDFNPNERIEYKILQTQEELQNINVRYFKAQYVPNLYLNFGAGWVAGQQDLGDLMTFNDETWFNYANIGLTLNIPIFDGLYKRYKNQQNRLTIQQIQQSKKQTQNSISREVQTLMINYDNAVRNMEIQEENMGLAEEVFDVTRLKFQEGLGTNLEVVEADNALKEAQNRYYLALYDAIIAKIDLRKALGRIN